MYFFEVYLYTIVPLIILWYFHAARAVNMTHAPSLFKKDQLFAAHSSAKTTCFQNEKSQLDAYLILKQRSKIGQEGGGPFGLLRDFLSRQAATNLVSVQCVFTKDWLTTLWHFLLFFHRFFEVSLDDSHFLFLNKKKLCKIKTSPSVGLVYQFSVTFHYPILCSSGRPVKLFYWTSTRF